MLLYFVGHLTHGTSSTEERHYSIGPGVALYSVSFPGLPPQKHDGDAREQTAQKQVERSTLAHGLGRLAGLAREAEVSAAAYFHISTAVTKSLFKLRHGTELLLLSVLGLGGCVTARQLGHRLVV